MPSTIQGFGAEFRGKRDFHTDGSYVTTEWVVLAALPIVPLRSLRVEEGRSSESFLNWRQEYTVYEELSVNVKQVACVYIFTLFYLFWIAGVLFLVIPHLTKSEPLGVLLLILGGFCLPLVIPALLRWRSKRRAGNVLAIPRFNEILEWWAHSTSKEKAAVLVPLVGLLVAVAAGFLLAVYT
jgi:hypothetical protein